jgi:hypothetical protein
MAKSKLNATPQNNMPEEELRARFLELDVREACVEEHVVLP